MTNQEIEVIRKALDTEENHKDYVKHVTEAKTILNKLEKAISVTRCCKSDSELLVCDDNELDCPYEFTSRCTMGRCDCKPKAK